MDHAPGVLSVEAETITAAISLIVTEGKRYTKALDVGEVVVVEEDNRVGLEVVPPNPLTEIKLRGRTSIKEVFSPSNINHPTTQAKLKTRVPKEDECLIYPRWQTWKIIP